MLNHKEIDKIVFLDIETTSQKESFDELSDVLKKEFKRRFGAKEPDKDLNELYSNKAPLYAEWGRILCISVGVISKESLDKDSYELVVKTFADDDESELIRDFITKMQKTLSDTSNNKNSFALCAHNGKIFDFPFIAKRIIINRFNLPKMFDYVGSKPWELDYLIDTKEVWKYNVFDGAVSLNLLTSVFGVPSSKDDIDGSEVKDIYYKEKDLNRISIYCEKDILALCRVYLQMKGDYKNVIAPKLETING